MISEDLAKGQYRAVHRRNVHTLPQWEHLDPELKEAVLVVSAVLPFRTNRYVTDELIDWGRVPEDPIYQLTFPQRGMLDEDDYREIRNLLLSDTERETLHLAVNRIRYRLNPHPAGQLTHNVPRLFGRELHGIQHKYRETVLFFPSQGQTCHAYCTFCFRWAQFVGLEDLKIATSEADQLAAYVQANPSITDVLITGGDPMVMKASLLERYIKPLLNVPNIRSVRIGTKSLAYWPARYLTDSDSDEVLRLFESVVASGRHLALMAHVSHPVELETETARKAIRRVLNTGAIIRMQSPVLRHINDSAAEWAEMWRTGVNLGCIPYYMFVERDTGARDYFKMPLVRCWNIFRNAYQQVSGLARTVRGPSMSCFPGKCHLLGVTEIGNQQVFALEFLQAREPDLVRRPFFARYDPRATWYDELQPFSKADEPFLIKTPTAERKSLFGDGSEEDNIRGGLFESN